MKLSSKVSVSITKASGRIIPIGVLKGGHWWERLIAHYRLWWYNRSTRGSK